MGRYSRWIHGGSTANCRQTSVNSDFTFLSPPKKHVLQIYDKNFDEEFTLLNLLNFHEQITLHKPRRPTGDASHGCIQRLESWLFLRTGRIKFGSIYYSLAGENIWQEPLQISFIKLGILFLWGVKSTGLNFIQPIRVHFNLPKSSVKCSLSLSFVIIKRVQFNGLQLNINEAHNW